MISVQAFFKKRVLISDNKRLIIKRKFKFQKFSIDFIDPSVRLKNSKKII